MLTVIIDIQDHLLINGQTGNIMHNDFAQISDRKVYVNFSYEQAGWKAIESSYLGKQKSWIPIKRCETEISIKYNQHGHSSSILNFP